METVTRGFVISSGSCTGSYIVDSQDSSLIKVPKLHFRE